MALSAQEAAGRERAPVIQAVEIRRNDVFDSTEATGWLTRLANRLHFTTREGVVRRELLLQPGEVWDSARAAETARNLRSLGVFRKVDVDSVRTDSGLVMRVVTRDGWSTRPDLRFRSTGGEVEYTVAFIEDNLLGTATQASVKYRKDVDRSSVEFGFRQPRFISRTVLLDLKYEDRSDGRRFNGILGRPFYDLASPFSLGFRIENRSERVLRFFGGEREASDSLQRRYVLARTDGGFALLAGAEGYLRLGVTAQVRRDNFVPESFQGPIPDSVTAAVGPWLEWRRARFVLTSGFEGFGREEDVDVSTTVRVGAFLAPKAFGYERDGIGPYLVAHTGESFGRGFVYLDLIANGLYSRAGLDSGSVLLGGTVVLRPSRRHSVLIHGDGGWLKAPLPGEEFDLGTGTGPRAFRSHAFTGDRTFFSTAEYRYTLTDELWKVVGVGLAGFVDYGGAWYRGNPRRTGWDAGVGLRLGPSRASGVEAIRVDLVRRFATDVERAGWVLVIGKGLTFSTRFGQQRAQTGL